MEEKTFKKKNDVILIITLLIAAAAFYTIYRAVFNETGSTVIVEVDGREYKTLSLESDTILKIEGTNGIDVLEIKNGSAKMISADCPDGICVRHNSISKNGESIICLPNKIVVYITGAEEAQTDAIAK